ncbi:hypothetical protein CBG25_04350, partial [Arsenophonus sp. ENCA]|uniref:DUF1454 family protein n=1 Tax=Arsenophonus sp. ENCA TaxID=1987579 RepID=UPI000BD0236E
ILNQRKSMVEPVFSALRGIQGLERFRRKGLLAVKLEFTLHAMAYNLSRAVALILWMIFSLLFVQTKIRKRENLHGGILLKKKIPPLLRQPLLERGSEKIKSLQLTLLPPKEANSYKINRQLFERYIMAIINHFEKTTSINNTHQLTAVLDRTLEQHNQVQSDETIVGAIRYILVKSKDNMITFAIEPVKLSLNDDNITHE